MSNVYVKAYAYPDGSWEGHIVACGDDTQTVAGTAHAGGDGEGRPQAAPVCDPAVNRARSIRRSRKSVSRIIRSHDLRRLLTFTNGQADGQGWQSGQDALDDLMAWLLHEGGRELLGGDRLQLLAVAERGGHGHRWHLHAVIQTGYRLDYSGIIASWSAFLEARGYRSASGIHRFHAGDERGKASRGFSSARIAARYASKYLVKGLADEHGTVASRHRFRTVGCDEATPWLSFRCGSLLQALQHLGIDPRHPGVYALKREDNDTGEHVFGYLFDLDPVLAGG